MAAVPSPADHPAATAALSVGTVSALIVTELHNRFGVDISIEEASAAVAFAIAAYHFARGKVSR